MKKIACFTDFSEEANCGVLFANKIARELFSELTLFHTYLPAEKGKGFHPSLTEFTDTESRELLYKMCLDLRLSDKYSDVAFDFIVNEGSPVERVNEIVKKEKIDLIVMSAEGELKENDTYYGTILTDVVLNAKCPVLIVPKGYQWRGINKIVYAFDIENENTFEKSAIKFVKSFGADLDILSFVHTEDENETERLYAKFNILKEMSGYNKIHFDIKVSTNIIKEMSQFILDRNSDLIILEHHKKTQYKQLLEPGFTKSFVFISQKPILVIRSKEN